MKAPVSWVFAGGLVVSTLISCGGDELPPVYVDTPIGSQNSVGGAGNSGDSVGDGDGVGEASVEAFSASDMNCSPLTELNYRPLWSHRQMPQTGDVIGLCNGWLVSSNQDTNSLDLMHASGGGEKESASFNAAPDKLAYDSSQGIVYVTLLGSNKLGRVDLTTFESTTFDIAAVADDVAVGQDGVVFVLTEDGLVAIDGATGAELASTTEGSWHYSLVETIPDSNLVVIGQKGLSPSSIQRLEFDPEEGSFTSLQEHRAGTNGQDLAISADGEHLAFPCGGGNGAGYNIANFSPLDFEQTAGEWPLGAYPRAAAFSHNNAHVVASDDARIEIYDAVSHVRYLDWESILENQDYDCSYLSMVSLRYSLDDRYIYALFSCGFDDDSGLLGVLRVE